MERPGKRRKELPPADLGEELEQRTPGRPKALDYRTVEARRDKYFADCDEQGKRYTWPGLAAAIGVTTGTLNKWLRNAEMGEAGAVPKKDGGARAGGARAGGGRSGEGKRAGEVKRAEVLRMAQDRMSDALQQRNDSMAVFALKQPCYGGYTDRPVQEVGEGGIQVNVSFGGQPGGSGADWGR